MECEKVQELISLYIDGMLDSQIEINELETHIKDCASCETEFNHILDIIDDLKSLPQIELPNNFHNELIDKIKNNFSDNIETIKNKTPKFKFKGIINNNWWKVSSSFVAACFVLVIVGVIAIGPSNDKSATSEIQRLSDTNGRVTENESITMGSGSSTYGSTDNAMTSKEDFKSARFETDKENLDLDKTENKNFDKKIIKNAIISIEVYNFEETMQLLRNMAEQSGGYIENSNSHISYTDTERNIKLKSGDITLKVPSETYDDIINQTNELGNVTNSNQYIEDVTSQYIDTESLLKAKRLEEQRLLDMMEKTQTIEDLILLEQRLSTVRGELETYTGRIDNWDKLVKFSTITIDVVQVKEISATSPSNLSNRMRKSFFNSINNIKNSAENFVVWLANIILPLILTIVFLSLAFVITKIIIKKSKRKNN